MLCNCRDPISSSKLAKVSPLEKTALNKNKEKSHPVYSREERPMMDEKQKEGAEWEKCVCVHVHVCMWMCKQDGWMEELQCQKDM